MKRIFRSFEADRFDLIAPELTKAQIDFTDVKVETVTFAQNKFYVIYSCVPLSNQLIYHNGSAE